MLTYSMTKKAVSGFKGSTRRRRTFFKEWRKYRRLTLEAAADRAGMTAGNLSAMERGAQGYTQAGLESLAEAYRCDPGQLLTVDPSRDEAIWSIWELAKPGDRLKIVDIAKTIVGKPETDQ